MKKLTILSSVMLLALAHGATPASAQEQQVTLRTNKAVGSEMTFTVDVPNATVDWGDGVKVQAQSSQITGTVKGENIIVYGNELWTTINCSDCDLIALAVTKAPNMRTIIARNNSLENINLIYNTQLRDLDLAHNQIRQISLTTCEQLERLNLSHNQLTLLGTTGITTLQYVNVANNQLSSLSLGDNAELDMLDCSNNLIQTLDLRDMPDISSVLCANNRISSLIFNAESGAPELIDVICDNNSLTNLDLSESTTISNISCTNNQLRNVVLPERPDQAPYSYLCFNNNLSLTSFSVRYSPEGDNLQFMPQGEYDITSLLLHNDNLGYYVYSQNATEGATTLAMTDERRDADGSYTNRVGFYAINGDTSTELERDVDYEESGNGNYTFLKEFPSVQGRIYSSRVDGIYVMTTPFAVVKDLNTGIKELQAASGLQVSTSDGRLIISSAKAMPVKVFSADGRLVWSGTATSSPQSISLTKGVYIVGGQKVQL